MLARSKLFFGNGFRFLEPEQIRTVIRASHAASGKMTVELALLLWTL
jgi:hypothetical protein